MWTPISHIHWNLTSWAKLLTKNLLRTKNKKFIGVKIVFYLEIHTFYNLYIINANVVNIH